MILETVCPFLVDILLGGPHVQLICATRPRRFLGQTDISSILCCEIVHSIFLKFRILAFGHILLEPPTVGCTIPGNSREFLGKRICAVQGTSLAQCVERGGAGQRIELWVMCNCCGHHRQWAPIATGARTCQRVVEDTQSFVQAIRRQSSLLASAPMESI